jgi:hypothetical protein
MAELSPDAALAPVTVSALQNSIGAWRQNKSVVAPVVVGPEVP